jgi:hypothetical protein
MDKTQKIFYICYNDNQIVSKGNEIINMELKLNLSPWSRDYIEIGNNLYDYYVCKNDINKIIVTETEFKNLKYLSEKTYDEYKTEIYAQRYN